MNKPNLCEARNRGKSNVNIVRGFKVSDEYKIGNGKTYYVKTYGCQMNERDSEEISAILELMGFVKNDDMSSSDVVILNTCAIRENAHNKVFGILGRLKHIKEEKNILVGFCGCMAQEEIVVDELLKHKEVDFVFGTHNIHRLPEILSSSLNKKTIEVWSKEGDIIEDVPVKRVHKHKAWVNIMYGCDKFCTYCIVPYTRGKQRSRLKEDIISEVNDLVKNNYQEVTLLGQNVNAYGKDNKDYKGYDFSNLLNDVAKTGIKRIKFVTSHPWDFTDKMIEVIKENKNILPYIHLPIQSGSDRILKLMGRIYTTETYKQLVDKLKTIPNICLTTDIIVGFPNETEEDFNKTLDMVNYCKYDGAYTFIYSKRVGTPAANMIDEITLEEKEQRLYKLNELVNKYSKESNEKQVGKILSVLVDGPSEKEGMMCGYSENNKLVNFKGNNDLTGKIVNVKILDAKSWSLDGEIVL